MPLDFVLANFAQKREGVSVLTFYRAFPYDAARGNLYKPSSYGTYRARFETQIEKEILPLLGLDPKQVVDLRMTRWGHALPVSAKGLYSDDTVDNLRRPFKGRVFFVEQDNWAYPAFYTGATEAAHFAPAIRKLLPTKITLKT